MRSAELLGLVQHHSTEDLGIDSRIHEVRLLIETALPPEDLRTIFKRGEELDLELTINQLLEEFAEKKRVSDRNDSVGRKGSQR